MKIAFLSDIHGNIEAFNTVLDVLEKDKVDSIYITGDFVGYYYHPDKVIDICMLRDDIHCIRGNHDRNFLESINDQCLMSKYVNKYGYAYALTKDKLHAQQISWLKNLPTQLNTEVNQIKITLAHGSIHSEDDYVYPTESVENLKHHLSNSEYTILGHTHHQFLWHYNNKWLVNPGSIGQPRDQASFSSFFYLDTINKTLIPRKVQFSVQNLIKEIEKYDPKNEYLKSVLMR